MVDIRRALIDDAPAIAAVKRAAWPDDTADVSLITRAIRGADHVTHAALTNRVVGFVDGFTTTSIEGVRRWEVDLLAVMPGSQGQGIGTRLIAASTAAGRERGAALARGLVHVQNLASQKAFEKCGYEASGIHSLYVLSGDMPVSTVAADAINPYVIPVQTYNYVGAWLEGDLSLDGLQIVKRLRAACGWDVAGAVISHSDKTIIQAAFDAGYTHVGDYQWWTLELVTTSGVAQSPP